MPPFRVFLCRILLAIACPLVSGRSRIPYPLAFDESLITPSKYTTGKHPSHPLASDESLIGPSKYATHRSHVVAHGRRLEVFHPPTTFKTFGDGIDQPPPFGFGPTATLEEMAAAITQFQVGINSTDIRFRSGFSDGPRAFAYLRQSHDNVSFANAVANVALHNNRIVAFGSSFVETTDIAPSTPSLNVQSIIPNAENALNGKFNGHTPTLEYLVRSDGSIALTHVVQIQNDRMSTWFEAFMDAHSGEILSVTDFVDKASYKVVPIVEENISSGQVTLVDPQDKSSSPMGWHDDARTGETTFTAGNNVYVIKMEAGRAISTRRNGADLAFDYTYMSTLDPTVRQNVDAARTNAFYVMNTMHDIAYKYGFTEKSFNFQKNNFGKGGRENDGVIVYVQNDSNINYGAFETPPDGQSAICKMHLWTGKPVLRDAVMDNTVLIHEFTHGITRRLTGGGSTRCLETIEARGLSEGLSDAMAGWVLGQKPITPGLSLPDYVIGRYIANSTTGLRTRPYSTSVVTNWLPYSSIETLDEVHEIGEVWANMLHVVHAALVEKHGFSEKAKTDLTSSKGNVVFMHLFMDALSIQPCNPTFVHARKAWIQADKIRYAGANKCLLWKAFASRGLGRKAAKFTDSASVPRDCRRTHKSKSKWNPLTWLQSFREAITGA
ncbi:metalloprotease [Infundibulicybe gibba]|nr:metalloprotease [Infundibulicybe gibba]